MTETGAYFHARWRQLQIDMNDCYETSKRDVFLKESAFEYVNLFIRNKVAMLEK